MSVKNSGESVVGFLRPILLVIGTLLMALAAAMFIPAVVDVASKSTEVWVFPASAAITAFVGGSFMLSSLSARGASLNLSIRQTFAMTSMVWVALTIFGSLPFMFGELHMSFTDAFFEAMSGITTTGSTVITGLDGLPPGILLWRGIMQWLGGLGIIVMSISILPMLKVGGMQMFKVEAFDTGGKALPRAAQISAGITVVFIGLTAVCALALWLAGMNGLEATVHAMTTIATGGYSTSDSSVGHFNDATIDAIITVGMIVGGIPFMLILMALRGGQRTLFDDSQVQWYLGIMFASMIALSGWLWITQGMDPLGALRYSSFTVASIMTGTGYVSADYTLWGMFPIILLFFLTFVGGCAGSTACGIKVFRFQVLFATAHVELKKIIYPNGVFLPYYNKRKISDEVVTSVLGYFFIFIFCFVVLTMALDLLGLDFITAISSAATAMSNVGPGIGRIVGPSGTFESLPDAAKWLLAFGMLLGRLEVFTVMVLFSRHFWKG